MSAYLLDCSDRVLDLTVTADRTIFSKIPFANSEEEGVNFTRGYHNGQLGALMIMRCFVVVLTLLILYPGAIEAQPKPSGNVVLRWNEVALDAIRTTRTSPPIAARALAITHTCIFDAWAAYDDEAIGTRLGGTLRRPKSERNVAEKEKAISFAAYTALVDLFPSQKTTLFDNAMKSLGYEPADVSSDTTTPSGIGNVACQAVLDFRRHDGSNQLGDLRPDPYSDYTSYSPANTAEMLKDPNRWQPIRINGVPQRWLLPHWGLVKPFSLTSPSEFRSFALSKGPFAHPGGSYRSQALAVIDLSAQLGDREKVMAEYWADGPNTETPPGHWNVLAEKVSLRDAHDLDQDVKLFFILGNALLDTSIAAWDVKRYTDSIRPITVIRFMFGNAKIKAWAGPGLGTQAIDCKDFRSYLPTPPFGGYISGHSAFSASAAEVLKRFTGSDSFGASFTAEPGSSIIEPGLTPTTSVTLSWSTFSAAADEAGMSRRHGGIHFESDDLVGRAVGRLVAEKAWNRSMAYIGGTQP